MVLHELLAAWRRRWNKHQDGIPGADYKLTPRGPLGGQWARLLGVLPRPAIALLWGLCAIILLPLPAVEFTIWGQLGFLAVLALFVLPLRPYFGSVPTGVLLGLAVLLSVRYLWWRASSTLVWSASPVLTLSMLLWVSEAILLCAFALRTVLAAWPLIRATAPLTTGRRHWPSIEVIAVGHDLDDASAARMLQAMSHLDWPLSRLQLHFLDVDVRPALRDQARELGISYRSMPELRNMTAREFARRMMGIGVGELLVIIDADGAIPSHLAQAVGPWFGRDPQLGLLYTPHSRLGAELAAHQEVRLTSVQGIAPLAVLRRGVWAQVHAATESAPVGSFPEAVRAQGFAAACIAPREATGSPVGGDQWIWLAHGATRAALAARDWGSAVLNRIAAVEPVAWVLFLGWPLFALVTHVNPIRANAWFWLANAIPVVLSWYFLAARTRSAKRFRLSQELRHVALALYLALALVPTTLRTLAQRLWTREKRLPAPDAHLSPLPRTELLGHVLWGIANLFALGVSLQRMTEQLGPPTSFEIVFTLWVTYNLLGIWIWWSVRKDEAAYEVHRAQQQHKSAMLRMGNGRTLACHTKNFPTRELELVLPGAVAVAEGDAISITVFHGDHEYALEADVLEVADGRLSVWIKNSSMSLYRSLAAAALTPDALFPRWLPGPDVARAIPKVVMRLLAQLFSLLLFVPRVLTRPLRSPLSHPTGKRPT